MRLLLFSVQMFRWHKGFLCLHCRLGMHGAIKCLAS